MARKVVKQIEFPEGKILLVQDRRDDRRKTDRWFVEVAMQIKMTKREARELYASVSAFAATFLVPKPRAQRTKR